MALSLMTLAALCAGAGAAPATHALPAGTDCPAVERTYQDALGRVAPLVDSAQGRDGIARVAYAEAGNQGDSGLAGVVYTILNRLVDGSFGYRLDEVLDAPHQFEPVMRAGGQWTALAARSAVEQAHIDTILNLALDGRLPDPTNGARFFQNPAIVASRASAGTVRPGLVNFGGQKPVAVIRDHAFYDAGTSRVAAVQSPSSLFVPVQSAQAGMPGGSVEASASDLVPNPLFVPLQSGR
jgi:hypothetical protein